MQLPSGLLHDLHYSFWLQVTIAYSDFQENYIIKQVWD